MQQILDAVEHFLRRHGIILFVFATPRPHGPRRREVHARVEENRVTFAVADPGDGEAVMSALDEQRLTADWTGDVRDRIRVDVS